MAAISVQSVMTVQGVSLVAIGRTVLAALVGKWILAGLVRMAVMIVVHFGDGVDVLVDLIDLILLILASMKSASTSLADVLVATSVLVVTGMPSALGSRLPNARTTGRLHSKKN